MYRSVFLLSILLFSLNFFAQEGFRSGYIVMNSGDTLFGKVKDRKFVNSSVTWQKIEFIDREGVKKNFTPTEIKAYGKGSLIVRVITIGIEAEKTFLEVVENGPVVLYKINHGSGWGGAGNAVKIKTADSEHDDRVEFFLQRRNDPNSLMQWRPGDYKTTAKQFFKSNAELMESIEEEKLKAADIPAIVKKYNEGK